MVAYNSSGTPVASYTGQYPRVTLDLPSGTYLLAATANGPALAQPLVCCVCAQSGAVTTSSPPALKSNSGPSASSAIAFPCYGGNQAMEYGYSLTQVSGSTSLTIDTQPPSSIPTADVSVSVSYKNGTAVSGADVSASVVGGYLSWGDNSNLSLYAQTAANGVAQLVVPAVPLTVTASESVQVNLTQSQTTVQVNVGGQPVNVTVYYSPNYVYLSASALLIPPQTSLSMVLSAQTQSPPILYGAGSASSAALLPILSGAAGSARRSRGPEQQWVNDDRQDRGHPPYPRVRPRVIRASLRRPRTPLASPSWQSARSPLLEPSRPWSASRSPGRGADRNGASFKAPGFSIVPRERDAWTGPGTSS